MSFAADSETTETSERTAPVIGKVVAFLEPGCPIARYHTATLRRCHEDYGPQGILFEGCVPNALATEASIARYIETYQLPFPVRPDALLEEARARGVTTVPEVLVYDKDERLVYRGRIDDTFAGIGKRRPVARTHDLADTLKALVDGKKLDPRTTEAVGCKLTFPPKITESSPQTNVRPVAK